MQTSSGGARPVVVILGGGFAGLEAARRLAGEAVDVVLVDRQNHHLFQPLLYQVATAGLSAPDIAAPIRRLLHRQRNARVSMAEVVRVEPERRTVILADGELAYDFLIVALGATHSYFGHDQWAERAPGLKTLRDALEIRRRVLMAHEAAEREPNPERRRAWLTFVVVGAGPTGVELAGALAELTRVTVAEDFRNFGPDDSRILLVEAADRILLALPPELAAAGQRQLERLGVEVRLSSPLRDVDAEGVDIAGERIPARTVVWAAGVAASPVVASLGAPVDRQGRAAVQPDLSVAAHPEVFVCGDAASIVGLGGPVPGVAPAAIQAGRTAARNIARDLAGQPRAPFEYVDRGSLATIGRSAAVGTVFGRQFTGFPAWFLWMTVHLMTLVSFRNRVVVLIDWIRAYFTYRRSARIVISAEGDSRSRRATERAG
ncbi:NAD(P)/FAD-dependent oxidoreductase [Engelhardtia mirabilis]|uniref:NADH:ubiquinone reductase (non-electrogenic) n=1 Tax=Engelhardtia mirabilis TaxID=2528011 RepID=A0A518BSL6_9BACT|nr:NADH dehydrogenase-like protein [Planctomycetes bacterium Pla133]QDV04283.1 NADH dehydrogenase-like protein [Planctomycetes bacterium Pla86]